MENNYPQKLIEQYLKTSSKLKKFDRVVFKRFAPNVNEVLNDFASLALKFEEAGIYQYAALCHIGVAKCESSVGNGIIECHAYLKAARSFLNANNVTATLHLRSNQQEYKEAALLCYTHALERSVDDSVLNAAIIREMTPIQPHYDGTSSFSSPAHRIYELEVASHRCIEEKDFLSALQYLDDIVDNIYERKQQSLYEDLLKMNEIMRILLLVVLNLPPIRQSPSHIKLIEYYYQLANFEDCTNDNAHLQTSNRKPGEYLTDQMKFALSEIVLAWLERKNTELMLALHEFQMEFKSLSAAHHFVIRCIQEQITETT